eukprot:gene11508-11651_t
MAKNALRPGKTRHGPGGLPISNKINAMKEDVCDSCSSQGLSFSEGSPNNGMDSSTSNVVGNSKIANVSSSAPPVSHPLRDFTKPPPRHISLHRPHLKAARRRYIRRIMGQVVVPLRSAVAQANTQCYEVTKQLQAEQQAAQDMQRRNAALEQDKAIIQRNAEVLSDWVEEIQKELKMLQNVQKRAVKQEVALRQEQGANKLLLVKLKKLQFKLESKQVNAMPPCLPVTSSNRTKSTYTTPPPTSSQVTASSKGQPIPSKDRAIRAIVMDSPAREMEAAAALAADCPLAACVPDVTVPATGPRQHSAAVTTAYMEQLTDKDISWIYAPAQQNLVKETIKRCDPGQLISSPGKVFLGGGAEGSAFLSIVPWPSSLLPMVQAASAGRPLLLTGLPVVLKARKLPAQEDKQYRLELAAARYEKRQHLAAYGRAWYVAPCKTASAEEQPEADSWQVPQLLRASIVNPGSNASTYVYMFSLVTGTPASLARAVAMQAVKVDHAGIIHMFGSLMEHLNKIHHNKIIHNGIKLENIIIDGQGRTYIVDFGVAAPTGSHGSLSGTFESISALRLKELFAGKAVREVHDLGDLGLNLVRVLLEGGPGFARAYSQCRAIDRWVQHCAAGVERLPGDLPATHMFRMQLRQLPAATSGVLDVLCTLLGPEGQQPKCLQEWHQLLVRAEIADHPDQPVEGEDKLEEYCKIQIEQQLAQLANDKRRWGLCVRDLQVQGCQAPAVYGAPVHQMSHSTMLSSMPAAARADVQQQQDMVELLEACGVLVTGP